LLFDLFDLPGIRLEFCRPRRCSASIFVGQINACARAETENVDPLLEFLDAELETEPVKVTVAGMDNRRMNIRLAKMRHRMHEVIADLQITILDIRLLKRDCAFAERRHSGHQFPG